MPRATASHTGAILSASDVTVDALFEQAGVIRAETLHEMFEVAQLLTTPAGSRRRPGRDRDQRRRPGIMCADACQADGVEVPELTGELPSGAGRVPSAGASVANPVDMIATATADQYRPTLKTLARF